MAAQETSEAELVEGAQPVAAPVVGRPAVISWEPDDILDLPSVAVVIPTFNEAARIDACLDAVEAQTYRRISQVLVVDGGSTDGTVAIACRHASVDVLNNPRRIQAAALNVALAQVRADIVVRVDGHCVVEADYVERCVGALEASGAAMVGGAMCPEGDGAVQRGIAAAMRSRWGAGPARFHVGGGAGWVDTVYLGAYRSADAVSVGGYAEDVGVNEDSEFALRMAPRGGVWFDPTIRSTYTPRGSHRALARQFFRYGWSRARTARRHPRSLQPRQLVSVALVAAMLSPARRPALAAYLVLLAVATASDAPSDRRAAASFVAALPLMHLPWGAGFLVGLVRPFPSPP